MEFLCYRSRPVSSYLVAVSARGKIKVSPSSSDPIGYSALFVTPPIVPMPVGEPYLLKPVGVPLLIQRYLV